MIHINQFGFGGLNAVVILDDTYHFLETIGRCGHHKTVEAPFAANAADFRYTDAHCQESHAIAAGIGTKQVLESTPKIMASSDWDGIGQPASFGRVLKNQGRKIRD